MKLYGLMGYIKSEDKYVWVIDYNKRVKVYTSIRSAKFGKTFYKSFYDDVKIVELILNFSEVI